MDGIGSPLSPRSQPRIPFCDLPSTSLECTTCDSPMQLKVPCTNAEFGCLEFVPYGLYGETSTHPDECFFAQCPCPFDGCSFSGAYRDLYDHAVTVHSKFVHMFDCGTSLSISFNNNQRVVLKENSRDRGELVVVDHFSTQHGSVFAVSCIAPKLPQMGNFSSEVTVRFPGVKISVGKWVIKRVRLSRRVPDFRDSEVILRTDGADDIQICINRVGT